MKNNEDELKIVFQDSGYTEAKMTGYSVNRAFLSPCGTFSCDIYEPDFVKFVNLRDRIALPYQRVQILVNGVQQMLGLIEHRRFGDTGTILTISGRDYLSGVLVADLDQRRHLTVGSTTLDKAVLKIFEPFGISNIDFTGNNLTRGLTSGLGGSHFSNLNSSVKDPRKSTIPDTRSEPNEKVFTFANKICAKEGFTIQATTKADTVSLCRPEYDQEPSYYGLYKYFDKQSLKNNVLSGGVDEDFSEVPTVIVNYGSIPGADGYEVVAANYDRSVFFPNIEGIDSPPTLFPDIQDNLEFTRIFAYTTVIGKRYVAGDKTSAENVYRPCFFYDKKSTTQNQLQNLMRRQTSSKFAKTLQCTYKVPGHSQNGIIWTPDTVTHVVDQVAGLDEDLYIEGVTFSYSANEGATTEIKCLRKYSYIVGE